MSGRSEFLDFMGWDINIFGRHRLRIDDVETLAKDLSDRLLMLNMGIITTMKRICAIDMLGWGMIVNGCR